MPSGSIDRASPSSRFAPKSSLSSVLLAIACTLAAAPRSMVTAQAPSAETPRLRTLFDEGLSFVDRQRWPEAEDRFRRCLAIRRAPVIEYNLASVLEAQGERAEAASLLQGILDQPRAPDALRRASAERLREIEPRLAHVKLVVSGARGDAVVSVDGRAIPLEAVGSPLAIDPGRHEFSARDGRSEAVVAIDADEGDTVEVQLALRVPTPAEAAALVVPDEPVANDRPAAYRRPWLWVAVSSGVVAVIVATAFLAQDRGREPSIRTGTPGLDALEMER